MIKETWLVGLPQGELQRRGVSATRCKDLHLRSSRPHSWFYMSTLLSSEQEGGRGKCNE